MAREIIEEPTACVSDDLIYVAVAKDLKDSKSTLIWAIQNSGGKRICLLHVHQPAQMIPLMGTRFPASSLKQTEVVAYREMERQKMHKNLDEHLLFCRKMGLQAEKLHIEMDSIEKGIVELISQYGIRRLVMGAASDKHYSRRMMDLKSKKAIYVREQAPSSCTIQFVCKGHLIHSRDGSLDGGNAEVASPLLQSRPNSEAGQSHHFRSLSVTLAHNSRVKLSNPAQDLLRRVMSANTDGRGGNISAISSPDYTDGLSTSPSMFYTEGSSDESDRLSRRSPSAFSTSSSSSAIEVALTPNLITDGSEHVLELNIPPQTKMDLHHSSPPSVLDGSVDDTLYDQLEQAMAEAENARREAYQETLRRGKAEKDAIEAMRKAKASESLYARELKVRKEVEEALENERDELEKMKSQRDEVKEQLQLTLDQKSALEIQVAESEHKVKELEQKIISAVDLLKNYKKERDELQIQRDNALREAKELREKQGEASSTHVPRFFSDFSFSEIEEATNYFHPSLKIGEGGYGSIYRGTLRHTDVAIKILHSNSLQGPSEFQQEVEVLSKLRHPNLITLIGACPESWTLVYEYLPNGSLEDRLSCRDNASPLSWQTRIRIAAQLCSALIFLHSCRPHSIVHGDLKPSNILLDANLVSKLSDFGICRVLSCPESPRDNTTFFWKTDPKGTFAYMDPEFLASGELTPKSDIYSFGIILLRLLSGRPALGITKEVQHALDSGKLTSLLDPLAGDWPFVQAEQLARLALRCCEMSRKNRPDLISDVWRIVEPMRASCGGTSLLRLGSEEHLQPPTYFICPIFQEVMRDPHVATDGFTYEAEALRGWLDSGHDTSPMTNLKLAHTNLVPNHALRSAIQEWLQNH
ncbi:putative U-box domain-containing protein kinase family protein [Quillaja saponaria]|uniref:RING-type E3 ubiquitin transferase n=1 Tax=Quillaja saponaria TaxID=32244 RepID=A0AAD7PD43_QUISA|nr:putative U-box domain-containing protein kinase family protein [Quillaja saponaria]